MQPTRSAEREEIFSPHGYIFFNVTGACVASQGPPAIATVPENMVPELSMLVPLKVSVVLATLGVMLKPTARPLCAPDAVLAEVNPPQAAVLENVAVGFKGKLPVVDGIPGKPKSAERLIKLPPAKNEPV